MSTRLAFGVTTGPGLRSWLPTPGGEPTPADDHAGPGSPVAVGPAGADPVEATRKLTFLVTHGTEVAAGAGVDLGNGFTSARLAGATGDRRDAVLAAMRFLGAYEAHRLGDRTAVLVALFGLSATKRVGAAANEAIAEERWAALQLASAVSDLVGPEQLEQVLELRAPEGTDPFSHGAASTLADHLSQVLTRYQRPRRLTLIVSLWQHVCARLLDRKRLVDLAATQTSADRVDRLRERHRVHFDESIVQQLICGVGVNPTLAAAARWQPPVWFTARELEHLLHDAIAATALLRFARTMSDESLAVAARRHHDELAAADACLKQPARTAATRRPEGAYSHPARPGRYVHDLVNLLHPEQVPTRKIETYVKERVAMARNYGVVVLDAVTTRITIMDEQPLHNCWDTCKPWQDAKLRKWRAATGFHRAPGEWEQPPLADAHPDGPKTTLAQRLTTNPETAPAELETPHDLLWYADLADALAPIYGNEAAAVQHARPTPVLDYDLPAPPQEPGQPLADSVPLAAAGVAQLVAFGATPPPRCGSWRELVEGVGRDAAVTEASVGDFPIPPEISTLNKQVVPGTALTVELGRDPRQLAEWSSYMGNCIGGSWYAEQAQRGQCILMALRDDGDGHIVANLDIRRQTGGWQVHELRARFNDAVDPTLAKQVRQWVKTLAPPAPSKPEPALPVPPVRSRGGASRRSTTNRLPADLRSALTFEVERALATAPVAAARRTYTVLASKLGQHADFDPAAAVVALRRIGHARHVELLHDALGNDNLTAAAVWRATEVRPLTTAIDRLDPRLREYDRLTTLTDDAPLPRTLRALVRTPEIAPAYAMDVVARTVRKAMGDLVGSETLYRSAARNPSVEFLCALVIATTCTPTSQDTVRLVAPGATAVPGFPATDLSDEQGPWQQALPAAAELGTPVDSFDQRIAEDGLRVPTALLDRGGWPALWHRARR
ncbi:hypothetical protein [Actinophytocola oryzae]|uniref:PcfJ-like protein n=1 Tax=Actinophytocola oryzae TaxID=502181 RepID=A0A4R7VX15_9PSEU|nr:hypothetical protein [Actinophytocola oryzae]TDV54188.1 hypothetical protein CLV71_104659 [Actinophytocola oryzae]